jgi:hypothetical protein
MNLTLFVLVVGTVAVAIVVDLIVLVGWLRRAAMNAFAAIGKKQFADREGLFLRWCRCVCTGQNRPKNTIKSRCLAFLVIVTGTSLHSQNPANMRVCQQAK